MQGIGNLWRFTMAYGKKSGMKKKGGKKK